MKKPILLATLSLLMLGLPFKAGHTDQRLADEAVRPLLKQLVTQAILPLYSELDDQAQDLKQAVTTFCAQPNGDGLHAVELAWHKTLSGWEQSSALLFGPAVEDQIDFTIYFRPVKKAIIKGLLVKPSADHAQWLDTKAVAQTGVGGQGLAALEYLLFDRDKSTPERVELFRKEKAGQQRCAYLIAASTLLTKNVQTIYRRWQSDGGNYAEAFYTAGNGSTYFTAAYQPLELLVNRIHQAIQAVEIKKLGVPLGLRGSRSGNPRAYPYKLEAWRSGASWQNIQSVLQGLQRLLKTGGILEALDSMGEATLAQTIDAQLNALLETKLASEDLFLILADDPGSVKPFYEQIRVFATTIRTGLAPALGVQLGFNQNDGD